MRKFRKCPGNKSRHTKKVNFRLGEDNEEGGHRLDGKTGNRKTDKPGLRETEKLKIGKPKNRKSGKSKSEKRT
jgi:hypothetical protein